MLRFIRSIVACGMLTLGIALALPVENANALTSEEREEGFVSLFNGRDLNNWFTLARRNSFSVDNGILAARGTGGVVLRTLQEYENYILRLEFKNSPGGNSGVFLHTRDHVRDSRVGGEIQILDSYGKEASRYSAGSLYDVHAPLVNAIRPFEEWNEMEIHFEWPNLRVTLNGELIQDIDDLDTHESTRYRVRYGNIGLQDHGSPVWFRNIRIKDLGGEDRNRWIPMTHDPDMPGWLELGTARWDLRNSELRAHRGQGALIHTQRVQDFHLWAYVKTGGRGFGAIYGRWNGTGDRGFGVLIDQRKGAPITTGTIIDQVNVENLPVDRQDWAPLQIIAEGPRIVALVNGTIVAEYDRADIREGSIVLMKDSCCGDVVFKDVKVKYLDWVDAGIAAAR